MQSETLHHYKFTPMTTGINRRKISPFPLLLLFSLHFITTPQPISALKIELFHRFSQDSPVNAPKLTDDEIKIKLAELSQARALSSPPSPSSNPVVMVVTGGENIYLVKAGIGTPPVATLLALDTGSNLIWAQCAHCHRCMLEQGPIYDPSKSGDFRTLPCDNAICTYYGYPCVNLTCNYAYNYNTPQPASTRGELATETFAFDGVMQNIVFGCGHEQTGFKFNVTVGGILGMGPRPGSFLTQYHYYDRTVRFSYCFPKLPWRAGLQSFIHLGEDATITNEKRTPMITPQGEELRNYSVNLVGITVETQRVDFAPGGLGYGCNVDSGTYQTMIPRPEYTRLEDAMKGYFSQFPGMELVDGSDINYSLCYKVVKGFQSFPGMMYHFEQAYLFVPAENVMDVFPAGDHDRICWNVIPSGYFTYLGAAHQANYRFLYDVENRQVSFAPENCGAVGK